ncbi:hypothetical protein GGI07_000273 [Coemansia sp. Benny D115]|nr:hypothetical protein GGI07_000273 [Coemansia sp. Benny D115]
MGYLNRYLLLLVFNVLNIAAFLAIVSVAVVNIVHKESATNLLIYYGYTGVLSLALLLSEFRVPRLLNSQARFLFTYTGRGIVLTYFGCIVYTNRLYNIVACIYTVSLGVLYLVVAWLPFIPLQHGILYNWDRWCCEGAGQFYAEEKEDASGDTLASKGLLPEDTAGIPISDDLGGGRGGGLADVLNPRLSSQLTSRGLEPGYISYQATGSSVHWPDSIPEIASPEHPNSPAPAAHGSPLANAGTVQQNESFVYGLTTRVKRPQTTGDEYLDSIVNSSQFARDILDEDEERSEAIVVRDTQSALARPFSSGSKGLGADATDPINAASRPQSPMAPHPVVSHSRPVSSMLISSPIPYLVFAPESREALNDNILQVTQALDLDQHQHQNQHQHQRYYQNHQNGAYYADNRAYSSQHPPQ